MPSEIYTIDLTYQFALDVPENQHRPVRACCAAWLCQDEQLLGLKLADGVADNDAAPDNGPDHSLCKLQGVTRVHGRAFAEKVQSAFRAISDKTATTFLLGRRVKVGCILHQQPGVAPASKQTKKN